MFWKSIATAAALGACVWLGACAQSERQEKGAEGGAVQTEVVTIETDNGPVRINVEIADDEQERNRGLMFRQSLADDHGMLFIFQEPEMASFWMRNTIISLDIIFIAPDGRIINIADHTTPYSEESIPADGMTQAVLEIRAGRAEELGIRPGDRVRHRIFPS